MSYGVRTGSHIGVDALVKSLGPRAGRAVSAVAAIFCITYAFVGFIGGWSYFSKMYEIGTLAQDMPVPLWVPRVVLPLGFALLGYRFAQVLYRIIRGEEAHLAGEEATAEMMMQQTKLEDPGRHSEP